MISISFSDIKMLWLPGGEGAPSPPFFFIHILIVDAPFPPPTAKKKNMHNADVLTQSNSFAPVNAHRRN